MKVDLAELRYGGSQSFMLICKQLYAKLKPNTNKNKVLKLQTLISIKS